MLVDRYKDRKVLLGICCLVAKAKDDPKCNRGWHHLLKDGFDVQSSGSPWASK